ncbi:PREDICTED: uncharacterized protein LOC108567414 [Nicrophorus vespilloides]|uniref:Uncharacterized protein LOC108567414 n=1 Tax=Nicrophorus vespilloides TaxID=110193 RepID=A0ABM1N937_NICVS|nr:PREDICTED: uncharacterized protein LOC108567414 [Nicrophorus vespilloides]
MGVSQITMKKFNKYLCCVNLTLATRFIGFLGLAVSAILTCVLINDKVSTDYNASRKTALVLGLDWEHFHLKANASHAADPEGNTISIIVILYAVLYLLINSLLIYSTITLNRWCTVPWIICELFSCVSKVVAMVFHRLDDQDHFSNVFVIGSICYILLNIWWWIVVVSAQASWTEQNRFTFHFTLTPKPSVSMSSRLESDWDLPTIGNTSRPKLLHAVSFIDSPKAYLPNQKYSEI